MQIPSFDEDNNEFPLEHIIVQSWRVDPDRTLRMFDGAALYSIHPDQIDDYWYELIQGLFNFDWSTQPEEKPQGGLLEIDYDNMGDEEIASREFHNMFMENFSHRFED